jgi:transketolase
MSTHDPSIEIGKALLYLCRQNQDIVLLNTGLDLGSSFKIIKEEMPEQYFDLHPDSNSLMKIAAGLSLAGKIPYLITSNASMDSASFAQVCQTISETNLNLKIAGFDLPPNPGYKERVADRGLHVMRSLPNATIIVPCDGLQAARATEALAVHHGFAYLRVAQYPMPDVTTMHDAFEIGKMYPLKLGNDITILACGYMVSCALEAANMLLSEGVSATVMNVPTIQPFDQMALHRTATSTGMVLVAEEPESDTGLGLIVPRILQEAKVLVHCLQKVDELPHVSDLTDWNPIMAIQALRLREAAIEIINRKIE